MVAETDRPPEGHTTAPPAAGPPGRRLDRLRRLKPTRSRVSKLTLRVLAVNILALVILAAGLLYLVRYEERLLQTELDSLLLEGQLFATAMVEGALERDTEPADFEQDLNVDRARRIVQRLYETTATRIRLYDETGHMLVDSRLVGGPGGVVEVEPLDPAPPGLFDRMSGIILDAVRMVMPDRKGWPPYVESPDQRGTDYLSVQRALGGDIGRQIWSAPDGGLIVGVATPVQPLREVVGAVLVTKDTETIRAAIRSVRQDIMLVFLAALGITTAMSLYLASTITRPIRQLASAADQVRRGPGREEEIPDFSHRRDEIGDLSGALRDMTRALWTRMDAIERFAADVAHEIKNPLSSLRSAVETTARVKTAEQQKRLLAIIQEDVQRLDRLISDISDASRLDAELSRAQLEPVDVAALVQTLVELYRATHDGDAHDGHAHDGDAANGDAEGAETAEAATTPRRVHFTLSVEPSGPYRVAGLESRLVQVVRNLITNAITFSPVGGEIRLAVRRVAEPERVIELSVADSGPGIPESKLEAIFDRFYTERPAGEKFGTHSGLGLSISKQIVQTHGGEITARNRYDDEGEVVGALFTVRIPDMG